MEDQESSASASAPLLEKKGTGGGGHVYVEGCPGCAVDRRKAANPGIPYGNFIYVWIVTLCTETCAACDDARDMCSMRVNAKGDHT